MNRIAASILALGFSFASILCGCSADQRSPEEKTAIADIKDLGGKVTIDEKSPGRPVIAVDLRLTKVTDEELEELKAFPHLQSLDLTGTKVTDAGLEQLRGVTEIQTLDLRDTQATDAGLACLKGMTQLQSLNLSQTKVTDLGMEHLKGLTGLSHAESNVYRGYRRRTGAS